MFFNVTNLFFFLGGGCVAFFFSLVNFFYSKKNLCDFLSSSPMDHRSRNLLSEKTYAFGRDIEPHGRLVARMRSKACIEAYHDPTIYAIYLRRAFDSIMYRELVLRLRSFHPMLRLYVLHAEIVVLFAVGVWQRVVVFYVVSLKVNDDKRPVIKRVQRNEQQLLAENIDAFRPRLHRFVTFAHEDLHKKRRKNVD